VGKPVGVVLAAWLAVRVGVARLPARASWRQIWGVGALCGIGFTMSLFLGGLAFDGLGQQLAAEVRLGVFTGSLLAAAIGLLALSSHPPVQPAKPADAGGDTP
jgi:NhaA family Na+:H+ antiporter